MFFIHLGHSTLGRLFLTPVRSRVSLHNPCRTRRLCVDAVIVLSSFTGYTLTSSLLHPCSLFRLCLTHLILSGPTLPSFKLVFSNLGCPVHYYTLFGSIMSWVPYVIFVCIVILLSMNDYTPVPKRIYEGTWEKPRP